MLHNKTITDIITTNITGNSLSSSEIKANLLTLYKVLDKILHIKDGFYIHSINVPKRALILLRNLSSPSTERPLSQYSQLRIVIAGLAHDIGKIDVDDATLYKDGKLTAEEYTRIKKHTDDGEVFLRGIPFLETLTLIIKYHHERNDGSGYYKLKEEKIPFESKILGVADVHDALTNKRSYKEAWSDEETLATMKKMNLDPEVMQALEAWINKGRPYVDDTYYDEIVESLNDETLQKINFSENNIVDFLVSISDIKNNPLSGYPTELPEELYISFLRFCKPDYPEHELNELRYAPKIGGIGQLYLSDATEILNDNWQERRKTVINKTYEVFKDIPLLNKSLHIVSYVYDFYKNDVAYYDGNSFIAIDGYKKNGTIPFEAQILAIAVEFCGLIFNFHDRYSPDNSMRQKEKTAFIFEKAFSCLTREKIDEHDKRIYHEQFNPQLIILFKKFIGENKDELLSLIEKLLP